DPRAQRPPGHSRRSRPQNRDRRAYLSGKTDIHALSKRQSMNVPYFHSLLEYRRLCYHPAQEARATYGIGRRMSEISIGRFQVVGTLGTGAHSTILHIRRTADSKNYALKVVPISGPQD